MTVFRLFVVVLLTINISMTVKTFKEMVRMNDELYKEVVVGSKPNEKLLDLLKVSTAQFEEMKEKHDRVVRKCSKKFRRKRWKGR